MKTTISKYNTEKLVKIVIHDKEEDGMYKNENIPDNCKLINGVLFVKPRVKLYYVGGFSKTYYFDDFEEAKREFDLLTCNTNWI